MTSISNVFYTSKTYAFNAFFRGPLTEWAEKYTKSTNNSWKAGAVKTAAYTLALLDSLTGCFAVFSLGYGFTALVIARGSVTICRSLLTKPKWIMLVIGGIFSLLGIVGKAINNIEPESPLPKNKTVVKYFYTFTCCVSNELKKENDPQLKSIGRKMTQILKSYRQLHTDLVKDQNNRIAKNEIKKQLLQLTKSAEELVQSIQTYALQNTKFSKSEMDTLEILARTWVEILKKCKNS